MRIQAFPFRSARRLFGGFYPQLAKKHRRDQLERSNLKRKIDKAMDEHSEERQCAKGNPHAMLARYGPGIALKV